MSRSALTRHEIQRQLASRYGDSSVSMDTDHAEYNMDGEESRKIKENELQMYAFYCFACWKCHGY